MRKLFNAVSFAQYLQKQVVKAGDIVIDATAGKGFDTVFLARQVGTDGHVYAFDIQAEAIMWTCERIREAGLAERVTLCQAGHEEILLHVDRPVRAAMFNLGYLPGASHDVITRPATTVQAVQAVLQLLQAGGLVTLVIYTGHAGGSEERREIEHYAASLPQRQFTVARYELINQVNNPPLVLAIEKLPEERVLL